MITWVREHPEKAKYSTVFADESDANVKVCRDLHEEKHTAPSVST
jgi:hypothetical protein